jgi:hypothetical protein
MTASGENFTDTMNIATPFTASGTIGKGYKEQITRMYVGLVQIQKTAPATPNGNPKRMDIEITAGAYGAGLPQLSAGPNSGSLTWSMQLMQDTGEVDQPRQERPFNPKKPAIGFVMVELTGGRVTGWIEDEITLTEQTDNGQLNG